MQNALLVTFIRGGHMMTRQSAISRVSIKPPPKQKAANANKNSKAASKRTAPKTKTGETGKGPSHKGGDDMDIDEPESEGVALSDDKGEWQDEDICPHWGISVYTLHLMWKQPHGNLPF